VYYRKILRNKKTSSSSFSWKVSESNNLCFQLLEKANSFHERADKFIEGYLRTFLKKIENHDYISERVIWFIAAQHWNICVNMVDE